jgi:uncharacterized protein DUF4397
LIRFLKFRFLRSLAVVALAGLVGACGSGNNNQSPAVLRFINASRTSALTLTLNGTVQFSGIATQSATTYAQVTPSTYTVSVTSTNGSLSSTAQVLGIGSAQTYSILAYDRNGAIVVALLTENQSVPTTGYVQFGIANESPDSGALDLYVVPTTTTSLSGLAPTFQTAGFGAAPAFTTLVAGTYQIIGTATGNPNDVRFRIPSQQVASTQILMLAFTSTTGGALVNGVLATQGGSVSFSPTTDARVRVVSALPVAGASPVAATVGGTAVTPVFSPNPGTYTLVAGGTTSYSISVAGTPIASLPAATFTTGDDFTILVYGASPSSPAVSVFTDNNQSPLAGNVSLRLVNAGVTLAGGVTMYDNNVQVANAVAYGAAAPYFGVTQSAVSTLLFVVPGLNPLTVVNVSLNVPAAVYTIFVIDNSLTANSLAIIRDR